MDVNTDNISLVPKFQFSTTLEQQECELITNPLLQRMKQVRKSLENDPSRPIPSTTMLIRKVDLMILMVFVSGKGTGIYSIRHTHRRIHVSIGDMQLAQT